MSDWFMVTLAGKDRPGIVAQVTGALYEAGCNLGETSMMRLGGNFGVLLMAQTDKGAAELEAALRPVADELGLSLHLEPVDPQLHRHPEPDVCITVHGADRAGIVAQVTRAAADAGLNILDLESDIGGTEDEPVYVLHIEGTAAGGVDALRQALEPLQAGGIKVEVRPIDTLIG